MTGIVTWAGLDVHARSTYAAAINPATGELVRARFGPGVEQPVAWLRGLPGPLRACYEAGPTGFGVGCINSIVPAGTGVLGARGRSLAGSVDQRRAGVGV